MSDFVITLIAVYSTAAIFIFYKWKKSEIKGEKND